MSRTKLMWSPYTFTEFYMLDAVALKLRDAGEDALWRPSIAYLNDMLNEVKPRFEKNFGRILRDYLWISSLGEARHAGRCIKFYLPDIPQGSRSETYIDGYDYPPTEYNREQVRSVFEDFGWGGGYGGDAWGSIVRALDLYNDTTPVGIFIDHAADLQHNGGMAFNKNPEFWDWNPGHNQFMSMMNMKAGTDDLLFNLDSVYTQDRVNKYTSSEVKKIVNLAWARFDCLPKKWSFMNGVSGRYKLSLYVSYGISELSPPESKYKCSYCYDPIGTDYMEHNGEYACSDCYSYCEYCHEDKHPATVQHYDGVDQDLCDRCREDYTSTCTQCGDRVWDMDIIEQGACRDCFNEFKECEVCNKVLPPNEVSNLKVHDGGYLDVCDSCAEGCRCSHCDQLYTKDDELYTQLKLKLDGKMVEVITEKDTICPDCVKNHIKAFQPVLKLEDSDSLIIGEYQTELYGVGMSGTPQEQASPISLWDLAGEVLGQTEMYYAESFNKLICAQGGK